MNEHGDGKDGDARMDGNGSGGEGEDDDKKQCRICFDEEVERSLPNQAVARHFRNKRSPSACFAGGGIQPTCFAMQMHRFATVHPPAMSPLMAGHRSAWTAKPPKRSDRSTPPPVLCVPRALLDSTAETHRHSR